MATVRRQLVINEVSLCRSPANPHARVALFKREQAPEDPMPFKFALSTLSAAVLKQVKPADHEGDELTFEKAEDYVAFVDKVTAAQAAENAELAKKAAEPKPEPTPEPDKIDKSALPENVRKYVEDQEAAVKKAADAAEAATQRVAKLEDDKDTDALNKSLDALPFAVKKDTRDDTFKTLKALTGPAREIALKALSDANKLAEAASKVAFREIGLSGQDPDQRDAVAETAAQVAKRREADPKLSELEARVAVHKADPELRDEYNKQMRTRANAHAN